MATVWVASRMPNGLIIGDTVLNKPDRSTAFDKRKPGYNPPSYPTVAGYALTEMDADEWNKWFAGHSDMDIIKNKIVFAHQNRTILEGLCYQARGRKTGLEQMPVDISKPQAGR